MSDKLNKLLFDNDPHIAVSRCDISLSFEHDIPNDVIDKIGAELVRLTMTNPKTGKLHK